MIQDWVVTFTYTAAAAGEDMLRVLEESPSLLGVDVSVAAIPRDEQVTVTLHLQGEDPGAVVEHGRKLLYTSGLPQLFGWAAIAVEAVTEAEFGRRADAPTLPELVGASEVGEMLGVSRQRVHQLREHATFPAPLVEVAMGPLWDARAVEAFARAWSRRPGRPPLAVAWAPSSQVRTARGTPGAGHG
ncbi:MAG: helix-turn-helix transcriptional regulator [Mycobacteriales bacterium]